MAGMDYIKAGMGLNLSNPSGQCSDDDKVFTGKLSQMLSQSPLAPIDLTSGGCPSISIKDDDIMITNGDVYIDISGDGTMTVTDAKNETNQYSYSKLFDKDTLKDMKALVADEWDRWTDQGFEGAKLFTSMIH